MTAIQVQGLPAQHERAGAHQHQVDDGLIVVTRVENGSPRTVGVFELTGDTLSWHAALDVQRLAERGQILAGVALASAAVAVTAHAWHHGHPQVGRVSMGPGGWVSVRGSRVTPRGVRRAAPRTPEPRPWWARVLGAEQVATPSRRRSWFS